MDPDPPDQEPGSGNGEEQQCRVLDEKVDHGRAPSGSAAQRIGRRVENSMGRRTRFRGKCTAEFPQWHCAEIRRSRSVSAVGSARGDLRREGREPGAGPTDVLLGHVGHPPRLLRDRCDLCARWYVSRSRRRRPRLRRQSGSPSGRRWDRHRVRGVRAVVVHRLPNRPGHTSPAGIVVLDGIAMSEPSGMKPLFLGANESCANAATHGSGSARASSRQVPSRA